MYNLFRQIDFHSQESQAWSTLTVQPVQANRSPFSAYDLVQPILMFFLPMPMGCVSLFFM